MKKTTKFKQLVLDKTILQCPIAHDPLCAKIIEKTGFQVLASGGLACDAVKMGVPDTGLLTLTEMADCAGRIVDATDLPVLADGDAGHGNVTNCIRTVQIFEKAGVAELMIEDQEEPTRCGHTSGKRIVTPDLTVLTLDSLIGNDAFMQAEEFHKSIGIDATILTKADADVKGGSALSVTFVTQKPILFIGVGQTYDDLEYFLPENFVNMVLK